MNNRNRNNDRQDGQRRKDAALVLLETRREQTVRLGRRAMLEVLKAHGRATIDDVRALVPLPEGVDPKVFGAVPGQLARAGIIRQDGFTKTTRPDAHARPVSVWVLVDPVKADRWLAANPELPDVTTADQLPLFDYEKTPVTTFGEPRPPASRAVAGALEASVESPEGGPTDV